jgi:hypothetical protein
MPVKINAFYVFAALVSVRPVKRRTPTLGRIPAWSYFRRISEAWYNPKTDIPTVATCEF